MLDAASSPAVRRSTVPGPQAAPEPPERRGAVLAAVLELMVRAGPGFSMADVARAASCSKETLYKWFGDREGLLTATVQWQAAKVRMPVLPDGPLDRASLHRALAEFAASWIGVITGEPSIALNRMAVGEAGSIGRILLDNGPRAMQQRLAPLFEAGRRAGLIILADDGAAFSLFYGLAIADLQLGCLLGDSWRPPPDWIARRAQAAASQFLTLCAPPQA
jgi:AcrR family transcriptional regulator